MNTREEIREEAIPPERLAEAGVWIARLHGGDRDQAAVAGVKQWLQASPLNARAFELATEVWEESQNLRRVMPFAVTAPPPRRGRVPLAFATATLAVAGIVLGIFLYQHAGVSTGVGEQRSLTLQDGTRVFLNTATHVIVRYDRTVRKVELKTGEALFDVAKRPDWPFVVEAGNRRVNALGTSFVVRRDEQGLAVTLVEGRVTVTPEVPSPPGRRAGNVLTGAASSGEVFTLSPGQRLTFPADKEAELDTPSLGRAIAWRQGHIILDDTPLSNAASEMNRYSSVKLVVERPEAKTLLVNGLFQVGDSLSFARAVGKTYGLTVSERPHEIVLSGTPVSGTHSLP